MILDFFLEKKHSKNNTTSSDRISRSVLKSICWRIIGTLDTIVISLIVTGTLEFALKIGLIELLSKMILFFFHERFWNKINWGKSN